MKHVQPREGFSVPFTFDNGAQKEIDLGPHLRGPIFDPIRRDPVLFRAMRVESGTIAWDNGVDIDADVLYYNLAPAWMQETFGACK